MLVLSFLCRASSLLKATEEKAVCTRLKAWATEDCGTHSYIPENEEGDIHTQVKTEELLNSCLLELDLARVTSRVWHWKG